jgi:glutaryl-CoA dehydrogenase
LSTAGKDIKPSKPLPPPNSDFYQLYETLPPEELATLRQVRTFMESKVAPNQKINNKYKRCYHCHVEGYEKSLANGASVF